MGVFAVEINFKGAWAVFKEVTGVAVVCIVGACLLVLLSRQPVQPQVPPPVPAKPAPAPAPCPPVTPCPPARPFHVTCPYCLNSITVLPSPTGSTVGAKVNPTK